MADEPAMATVIHIHEDDWGMRRLYPISAAVEVADEVRAAQAASDANRAPDGSGWTQLHVIQAPTHDYTESGLSFARVDAVLAPILPRVRRFAATAMAGFGDGAHDPFGTYEDDAYCYGADATCFIKLDGDDPLVRQIWFQAETQDAGRLRALRDAIVALDQLVPSVIADYWLDRTGTVGDDAFLDDYMRLLGGAGED
ncbi:hypothetical protein GCM10009682_06020 [Luedemannella flava]|uniref:Uncharacterized protein n=1 Tax=Luedemannella flava TaxID=349316 RepID=A0ABP4XNK7_9ACTN